MRSEIMSFFPPSRSPLRQDSRTTSQPELASYPEVGNLLFRRRVPHLFVVDHQPAIAGLMSQLLAMRGYEVVTATSAEEAEAEIRRQPPDLILSDVMMPGKSGYDLCASYKKTPPRPLIPLFLT